MDAIRPVHQGEVREVLELLGCEWEAYKGLPEATVDQWKHRIREQERLIWVCCDGDVICGVAIVKPLYRPQLVGDLLADAELAYLVVDVDHQGAGVGTRLEEFVIAEMAGRGFRHAYLDVQLDRPGSIAFWRSRGWIEAGEVHAGERNTLTMTKALTRTESL